MLLWSWPEDILSYSGGPSWRDYYYDGVKCEVCGLGEPEVGWVDQLRPGSTESCHRHQHPPHLPVTAGITTIIHINQGQAGGEEKPCVFGDNFLQVVVINISPREAEMSGCVP